MTSATGSRAKVCGGLRTRGTAPGFTLLEVLAVLLVIAVLAGTAAGLVFRGDGFRLAHARDDVTALVRKAARLAVSEGSDHLIRFDAGGCVLLAADGGVVEEGVSFPEGSRLGLRGFGQSKFSRPEREGFFWVMQASGLCQPLTVRLEMGDEEWEIDFGPLAGAVVETRSTSYR